VALPPGLQRTTQVLAVAGLFAIFISMLLAALWGASRSLPIAGAGHRASQLQEITVAVLIVGGSLAITIAVALVLWGLCVSRA
jgi:(hydroxyamino)benzene mutase